MLTQTLTPWPSRQADAAETRLSTHLILAHRPGQWGTATSDDHRWQPLLEGNYEPGVIVGDGPSEHLENRQGAQWPVERQSAILRGRLRRRGGSWWFLVGAKVWASRAKQGKVEPEDGEMSGELGR
jgi:hypothetical protein